MRLSPQQVREHPLSKLRNMALVFWHILSICLGQNIFQMSASIERKLNLDKTHQVTWVSEIQLF